VFEDLATPELWGEQRTLDFLTKFSGQVRGLIRSGEEERIVNGEFDLMAQLAGLRLRERWGDWDRSPFTADSTKHVSVWEKP